MRRGLSAALSVVGAAFVFASPAVAEPPVLVSVSHVDRHPEATWTLPPGVTSQVAEVATSPATSTDGYFFSENVKASDVLERAQTHWVHKLRARSGDLLRAHRRARRTLLLRRTLPRPRVHANGDARHRAASAPAASSASSASTSPVRGQRSLDPPGRSNAGRNVSRRHRPGPLP